MEVDERSRRAIAKTPRICIIVLNWNNYHDTKECLDSIRSLSYSNFEVLVVNNGSTEGSGLTLAREFSDFTILQTGANLGYAGGNNAGMKVAFSKNADIVLILNNDVVVETTDLLNAISLVMRDTKVGIVGPRIVDYTDRRLRVDNYDASAFFNLVDRFCLIGRPSVWISPGNFQRPH
jgi:hypothetical protein